nr:hypothetical protein [Tanacetum cinerariifolium]
MYKEDRQATCGPTSLGVTSEARANPQLSSGMSSFNLNDHIYSASFIIHSESASRNDASASTAKADPGNSAPSDFVPQQNLNEDENDKVHAIENVKTNDNLVPKSLSPKSSQIQELTKQVLILQSQKHKLELEKNKVKAALLKAQPSFPNVEQLKEQLVKSLKTKFSNILFAHEFSSSLPTKLKDLSSKLNEPTREVKGLKKQVHELEIKLPRDLKEIPTKLDDFTKNVTSLTSQYDRYCDKMLNRRAKLRITNCDILTRKGPITLKVYREDDTSEITLEIKSIDLHLGEWREVITACPNKKGKRWTSIYKQVLERMDYLHTTEAELGIDLDRPPSEQDSLDRLNDLANKKRKHADDIHDFFRANKRLKQDFVTIKDFRDFSNTMLYSVQKIFFTLHQGLRLDDHARTFSSLLLTEIDKRYLNPLKQIRVIKQLRQ